MAAAYAFGRGREGPAGARHGRKGMAAARMGKRKTF